MTKVHWARGAWAVAAIMATGIASAALPQQTRSDSAGGQAAQQNQRDRGQQRAMAGRTDLDHFLVKVVIKANKDEIASARLAQQKSSNPDIKKFAMQMVEDHTRLMNRLEQVRGTERGEKGRGMQRSPRVLTPGAWTPSAPAVGLHTQPPRAAETASTAG
jgi:predicted outer membrane protein